MPHEAEFVRVEAMATAQPLSSLYPAMLSAMFAGDAAGTADDSTSRPPQPSPLQQQSPAAQTPDAQQVGCY